MVDMKSHNLPDGDQPYSFVVSSPVHLNNEGEKEIFVSRGG